MGGDGREEAQEAQEGAGFDPEEGAAMEERSRFGDEVARALTAALARFAPYRGQPVSGRVGKLFEETPNFGVMPVSPRGVSVAITLRDETAAQPRL